MRKLTSAVFKLAVVLTVGWAASSALAFESWSCHNFGGGSCIECTRVRIQVIDGVDTTEIRLFYYGSC